MSAAAIKLTCPQCNKTLQVPPVLQGKKVRCSGCTATLLVPAAAAPAAAKAAAAKAEAPAPPPTKPDGMTNEEWGVITGYGLKKESDAPRCPFCANDLEDERQVVCLNCGYNLLTRDRLPQRVLQPVTLGQHLLWLLPGIACLLVALLFVGLIVAIWTGTPDLSPIYMDWIQTMKWSRVYSTVACLFVIWSTGYFAFRRLVLNFHPPEVEKHLGKDGEEE